MSHWQERITRETPPTIVAEHDLRYRLAAPLILASTAWADLGCGNGVAAAAALGENVPSHTILVDQESEAVACAARELNADNALQIAGDLTDPELLGQIGEELLRAGGNRIVTCFEVVEHLSSFLPLLEWSVSLARQGVATFVLSVPNDAFWSIENPFHAARWSDGAFEELRRLLPCEQTLLRQVALTGSALVSWDDFPESHHLTVDVGGEGTIATHFIAAFGPRHHELTRAALAVPVDQLEQRRWERQRETNLAVAEARLDVLSDLLAEREEWRAYIHELERELGRPLSGMERGQAPS